MVDSTIDDDDASRSKSLRDTWVFRYKPVEILAAARKRVEHHKERKAWWESEAEKSEKKLKDRGFEYRDYHGSAGRDIQIVGDPDLARRLAECQRKNHTHRKQLEEFETWVRALQSAADRNPGNELELKIVDILYFGL